MTYKTRDSPTVIQPRHYHPMLTTACRSTSRRYAPWRGCVAPPRPPGRRAREMIPGSEERFLVLVMAARIWPQASHLVDSLAARALFDERT